jgi:hypothetical protein
VRRHFNRGDGRLQQDPSRAKIVSPLKNWHLDRRTKRPSADPPSRRRLQPFRQS